MIYGPHVISWNMWSLFQPGDIMEQSDVSRIIFCYGNDTAIRKIRPCKSILRRTGSSIRVLAFNGREYVVNSVHGCYHILMDIHRQWLAYNSKKC